jgi:hypothetical protein
MFGDMQVKAMGDTGGMNRERAEAHRLLAEEELRRAVTRASDSAAGSSPDDEAARDAIVTGTPAGSAAAPDAVPVSRGEQSADHAVIELYSAQYQALVRLAALLVRDARTAEQVVQDSFAAMRDSGPQRRDPGTALAYLRQAVVNRSRSIVRVRSVPGGVHRARVAAVALVLTAVGAVDGLVADQILEDFELALAARQAGFPGRRGPRLGSRVRSPGPAGPGTRPGRVVRLGQVIPVRGADVSGEVYLLSYARTASGPQFSLLARIGREPGPDPVRSWPEVPVLEQFTVTDDRGTRYQMRVRDLGGGADGWTLMLDPDPPHDPRWLDLTAMPGEPAVRIELTRPPDAATVTVSEATSGPGEHLLHALAAWLLAEAAAPVGPGSGVPVPGPRPLPAGAGGLGDVVAALQAAGALSPLSPVPGQLAALCAHLNVSGHGLTAAAARDLPEPWLSVLAHCQRRKTTADPGRDGCAAAAITLPDLDGITLAILGLHTCQGSTVVHAHASGPMCHHLSYRPAELYYWPVIWIRDSGGRWHTTCTRGQSGMNDELALRLARVSNDHGLLTLG